MVFKKVCPRCKRRYPQNFTACLECGSPLIDTEKEAKKAELQKYLPILGKILLSAVYHCSSVHLCPPASPACHIFRARSLALSSKTTGSFNPGQLCHEPAGE